MTMVVGPSMERGTRTRGWCAALALLSLSGCLEDDAGGTGDDGPDLDPAPAATQASLFNGTSCDHMMVAFPVDKEAMQEALPSGLTAASDPLVPVLGTAIIHYLGCDGREAVFLTGNVESSAPVMRQYFVFSLRSADPDLLLEFGNHTSTEAKAAEMAVSLDPFASSIEVPDYLEVQNGPVLENAIALQNERVFWFPNGEDIRGLWWNGSYTLMNSESTTSQVRLQDGTLSSMAVLDGRSTAMMSVNINRWEGVEGQWSWTR